MYLHPSTNLQEHPHSDCWAAEITRNFVTTILIILNFKIQSRKKLTISYCKSIRSNSSTILGTASDLRTRLLSTISNESREKCSSQTRLSGPGIHPSKFNLRNHLSVRPSWFNGKLRNARTTIRTLTRRKSTSTRQTYLKRV